MLPVMAHPDAFAFFIGSISVFLRLRPTQTEKKMSSITFEEVFLNAYVQDSVNAIMDTLVRQYPMLAADKDEIRQDLLLILHQRLPNYNPESSSIERYCRVVLDSAVKEARRSRLAKRQFSKTKMIRMAISMDEEDVNDGFLIDEKTEKEKFCAAVRAAVALLPPVQQRICEMLADGVAYLEIKKRLRISYNTLANIHIPAIRAILKENIY